MFRGIFKIINSIVDPFVLMIIIFIAVFEYFVDRPAFKKDGVTKDAKVTTLISIVFLVGAVALFVITMF